MSDFLALPRSYISDLLPRPASKGGRQWTRREARLSVLLDLDSKGEAKSQRDYAAEWGWTRAQVRSRLPGIIGDVESWPNNPSTTQAQPKKQPLQSAEAEQQPNNNPSTTQNGAAKDPPNGSLSPTPPIPSLPPVKEKEKGISKDIPKKKEAEDLPDWIDPEVWKAWKAFRQRQKKPLTDRAVALQVSTLRKLREAGQDPNAVIDQSIEQGWTGLYELKNPQASEQRESLSEKHQRLRRATGLA